MAWQWVEYIKLAQRLVPAEYKSGDDHARVRSVISRAYYAAFNEAKRYALGKRWLPEQVRRSKFKHGDVWQAFMARDRTEEEKEVGAMGDALMDDRQEADYEANFGCDAKACESAIERALKILTFLNVLPQTSLPESD